MSQTATPALREQIRAQVRRALAQGLAASARPAAATPSAPAVIGAAHGGAAVIVPLRVSSASDSQALTELIKRLGASPALLQATQNGLLRFDLRVDAAMAASPTQATQPAPSAPASAPSADCCDACKAGKTCACGEQGCDHAAAAPAPQAPLLEGVVSEKRIKSLAAGVKSVRIHPKAVLTPLGKEALRKRGITIDRGATP
jgi:hypothetical protein